MGSGSSKPSAPARAPAPASTGPSEDSSTALAPNEVKKGAATDGNRHTAAKDKHPTSAQAAPASPPSLQSAIQQCEAALAKAGSADKALVATHLQVVQRAVNKNPPAAGESTTTSNTTTAPAATTAANKARAPRRLDIVQFNDVYNLEPTSTEEPVGGAARFATLLNEVRAECARKGRGEPLVVFCGDFVGPSLMSAVTHGAHVIEALNYLGVHYGTLGNHEFDYGYTSLVNRLAGVDDDVSDPAFGTYDFPHTTTVWLSTNLTEGATGQPAGGKFAKRTELVTWGAGGSETVVGLLGVSENWLDSCLQLKKNEILYEDYIASARAAAKDLRQRGAEIVIAVCHNRIEGDRALAVAVPEIDLILGGHDHFYKHDRKHRLVKSGEEFRWLTHLRLELDGSGGEVEVSAERYDVDSEIAPDPKIGALCQRFKELADRKFRKTLITTGVVLDPREEVVRFREGTLPNFICDACAEDYSQAEGLQSADFALLSGFTFSGKAPFAVGPFTLGDLTSVLSRPITLVVLKLTGDEVVKSLQVGVKKLPGECGALFHVSGRLKYTVVLHGYDSAAGIVPKPSVRDVLVDDKPIEKTKTYTVAVSDSTATGLFGLPWMRTAPRVVAEENATQVLDVVMWFCQRRTAETALVPSTGRITIVRE